MGVRSQFKTTVMRLKIQRKFLCWITLSSLNKKSTVNLKKSTKNYTKLKVPTMANQAYNQLIKNMSMFSLGSPTNSGLTHSKTVTSCKNINNKKMELPQKRSKKFLGNTR